MDICVCISGVQQHAVPKGGQGEPGAAVRVPQLRLQANRGQQLHLREQDHARGRRDHQYRRGRYRRPHSAEVRGSPVSEVQAQGVRLLPGE